MGTPDDLEEFSACQRGYLGENLAWSDLSRGALRWVDGPDEHARHAGFTPRLSGVKSEDEALYIAHHHHWQTVMLAALEQEQSVTTSPLPSVWRWPDVESRTSSPVSLLRSPSVR